METSRSINLSWDWGGKDKRLGLKKQNVLNVSVELLFAATGPVVTMKSCLDEWRHDAAHTGLVSTTVPLTIMLHTQTVKIKIKQAHKTMLLTKNEESVGL